MTKEESAVLDDVIQADRKEASDFSKVVKTLLDENYYRRKTILTNSQVPSVNTIDVIAQIYDIKFLKIWINGFAEWRTSGDGGKGRQDIVDISKFHYQEMQDRHNELFGLLRDKK